MRTSLTPTRVAADRTPRQACVAIASGARSTLQCHARAGDGMSRHERQREQIVAALGRRQFARVLVLSREHLAEFPDDLVVQAASALAADALASSADDE
jgi:hypothetical protein